MTDDFFKFYWFQPPKEHFYRIQEIDIIEGSTEISSLKQLKWGFNRLFTDCLFVYGNIQMGYEELCGCTRREIEERFVGYIFNTGQIIKRGNTVHFADINREDRYLISEMACKTFDDMKDKGALVEILKKSYRNAKKKGVERPTFRKLLDGDYYTNDGYEQLTLYPEYSLNDVLDDEVESEKTIDEKAEKLADRFVDAHGKALKNTELYLSLVSDLDIYVATSMRTKEDFLNMASFCENVFKSNELKKYDLRYFDPTISAADSHEDKGLIECLMVKSARMLIYHTGTKDSFGKDVEAAMALCMGKPTIFFCSNERSRADFFRKVHPLSRLVNFKNGVAGGVIVCVTENEVIDIVNRIITNKMEYEICKKAKDREYYLLKEKKTDSIIRVQTDFKLLTSAFWNNYVTK